MYFLSQSLSPPFLSLVFHRYIVRLTVIAFDLSVLLCVNETATTVTPEVRSLYPVYSVICLIAATSENLV